MATMKASTIPMITLWKRNKTDDYFIFAIWELALHGQNLAPIHNPILLMKPVTIYECILKKVSQNDGSLKRGLL